MSLFNISSVRTETGLFQFLRLPKTTECLQHGGTPEIIWGNKWLDESLLILSLTWEGRIIKTKVSKVNDVQELQVSVSSARGPQI